MSLSSINPVDGSALGSVEETSEFELEDILAAAAAAAAPLRAAAARQRSGWIGAVADALDADADRLIGIAGQETGLAQPRLIGELARTTGQLRFLAAYAETGAPFEPTIDTADPRWIPSPRPDLRSVRTGLGVVLVFAASNFPFAFGVAGGDTASAWAAGCPAVVKAHPGHPLLSVAVAEVITASLTAAGAPAGMFAAIHGLGVGVTALRDPRVSAGAFTGSVAGGRALYDIATARPEPIPFFAEMGSINPVVVTEAAGARVDQIASGLADSFLLGTGQFCTKPGLVLVPTHSELPKRLAGLVATRPAGVMLNHGIRDRHRQGIDALLADEDVTLVGTGTPPASHVGAYETPVVASTTAAAFLADPHRLGEERFGPSTLLVTYDSPEQLHKAIRALPGSLTGTVQRGPDEDVAALVDVLSERVGRVLVDEWPTGVAVTWAQFHGGPYPSTTGPSHTAVGSGSISRFLRTVAYQNVSDEALPAWLRGRNPLQVLRRVNGTLTCDPVERSA